MSWEATSWAARQRCGSPQAKVVLMVLANRHNPDTGQCDPEIKRIAAEAEMSTRSVYRVLEQLEVLGLIERQRRAGGHEPGSQSNNYRFPALEGDSDRLAHSGASEGGEGDRLARSGGDTALAHSPPEGDSEGDSECATVGSTQNRKIEPKDRNNTDTESDNCTPGARGETVDNPPPELGGFRLACRCPDFEQAALAFIASKGRDTWLSWFGSAGLTGADPPCLEVESEFKASHVRTHFLEFFETRLGRKITIKVKRARRAQGTGRAAGPQRPAVRQSKGGRYAAR